MKKAARPERRVKPSGPKGGRPELDPTPEQRAQIETLFGFGLKVEEVEVVTGIGHNALYKHFRAEIARGKIKADVAVLNNLFRAATMDATKHPSAITAAIFWTKVNRRWHEVQRVIHGYDPEVIAGFVKQVTAILRKELPDACPHCHTKLDLPVKIAKKLQELSEKMASTLPPSTIVPIPPRIDETHQPKRGEALQHERGKG